MRKLSANYVIKPLLEPTEERKEIDIEKIRALASESLDFYEPQDRAYAWLALMGIYPKESCEWESKKAQLKQEYWSLVPEELINWQNVNLPSQMPSEEFTMVSNKKLMSIIHGDLVRTGRTLFFFPRLIVPDATPEPEDEALFQVSGHIRRLERILYVFSMYHVGNGYMQGFNELLPPLYYVLISSFDICDNDYDMLEALSFFMFQELMTQTDVKDMYTTSDSTIIFHKLNRFKELLDRHLPKQSKIIKKLNIDPIMYSYKWFNLLFSQEHTLPNLLNFWDALFSHFDNILDYAFYLGVGHIFSLKDKLVPNEYGDTIAVLQNLDVDNSEIKPILQFTKKCWEKDHNKFSFSNLFKKH